MKLEAEKHQGQRKDLTSDQIGQKLPNKTTREKVAEELGESATNIQRYIRLTELIPELLKLVDEERIAFSPAVDLSYLTEDEQYVILNIYDYDEKTPNARHQRRHINSAVVAFQISRLICKISICGSMRFIERI